MNLFGDGLGESQRQPRGGVKIDGGRTCVGKWRRGRIKEFGFMQAIYCACLVMSYVVPDCRGLSYPHVNICMFSCMNMLMDTGGTRGL